MANEPKQTDSGGPKVAAWVAAGKRILEGIVTTVNEDGTTNISPMGPIVDDPISRLTLRPFQTSTTYRNLKRTGQGVLHVTDDVELIAKAAIGKIEAPTLESGAGTGDRRILANACRWYAFDVVELSDSEERTTIQCSVVDQGRLRDFFGFNRAKHAVVEAAILATRVGILPDGQIRSEIAALQILVEKTGGQAEHRAFGLLLEFVAKRID